ncbi:unnamed protein product [Protopolystoma xenopodis]|uniref:Uncharacterized protein n=1 Tax=Protopolystoma xenopodis TaxID=117903 RepID=A0A3S5AP97_9PLAT|nr:unnamed protein product [Protopolystoma xenopodis]
MDGVMFIMGKFKQDLCGLQGQADFCLYLTSLITEADFHAGYWLTGTLQRGCKRRNQWDLTHYAMVRRRGY